MRSGGEWATWYCVAVEDVPESGGAGDCAGEWFREGGLWFTEKDN